MARHLAFDTPLALTSGGNITIEGTYRLTRCPDLLPTSWPTPSELSVEDWKRTFTRTQVPLRTARAICPEWSVEAKELRGLSGTMLRSRAAVVRLRWEGKSPLVVSLVGCCLGSGSTDTVNCLQGRVRRCRSGATHARGSRSAGGSVCDRWTVK